MVKLKLGKIVKAAAKVVAQNPNKVKVAAAILGVSLPTIATKGLDLAEALKRQ